MKLPTNRNLQAPGAERDHPARERAIGWTPRRTSLPALRPHRPTIAGRVLAFLLMVPLLIGVAAPPVTRGDDLSQAQARQKAIATRIAQQKDQVARLQKLQAKLSTDIKSTAGQLSGINANLNSTKKKVASLNNEIGQVRAVYLDLLAQIKDLDAQITSLEAQQQIKVLQLADRKQMLAIRLRDAYRTDRIPIVQQLLSAGSIADVFEDVGSYMDFGVQDRDLAQQIEKDQQTLATMQQTTTDARTAKDELRAETLVQKQELDARMADLKAAQAHLAELQAETRTQLAKQQATWTKMQRTTKNIKAAMAKDEASEGQLAAQIRKLIAARARARVNNGGSPAYGSIPSSYNGTLQWPMQGSLTQEFGCTGFAWEPPKGGCAHFHEGIDIAAPKYTPIHAAAAGTVVFAGANPYDSNPKAWIVIIAHSNNLQTWYAHVDNGPHPIAVHAGQVVSAGEVIAFEGMTGHTTGPHLHWAVMYNGSFVNPRMFT